MKKLTFLLIAVTAAVFLLVASPQAEAFSYSYGFQRITGNAIENVASQLSVDVADANDNGAEKVSFPFRNNVGIASSICDIYFQDGPLLDIASILTSGGVSFGTPAKPGDLPGGKDASPPFITTEGFSADSDDPVASNGVNAQGEWVTIFFNLSSDKTYDDVIAAIADGSLRIGLHVQAIGANGKSDSYVNTTVPIPAAAWLLGTGLLGLVAIRRRSIK